MNELHRRIVPFSFRSVGHSIVIIKVFQFWVLFMLSTTCAVSSFNGPQLYKIKKGKSSRTENETERKKIITNGL